MTEESPSPKGEPLALVYGCTGMYTVYVLQSKVRSRYYIGVTENIEKRIKYHNKGYNRSTKPYIPWDIIYTEMFNTKKEAYAREYYLKHPKGYREKKYIVDRYKKSTVGGVA